MRLTRRNQQALQVAPHGEKEDALGGVGLGFTPRRISLRGCLQSDADRLFGGAGGLRGEAHGLRDPDRMRALLPAGAEVFPGDGICAGGAAEPQWLVTRVERFSGHTLARLEKIR